MDEAGWRGQQVGDHAGVGANVRGWTIVTTRCTSSRRRRGSRGQWGGGVWVDVEDVAGFGGAVRSLPSAAHDQGCGRTRAAACR